jgi:hypothetical protein
MSPFACLLCSLVATFRVTLARDVVMTTVRLNAQGENPQERPERKGQPSIARPGDQLLRFLIQYLDDSKITFHIDPDKKDQIPCGTLF